MRGSAPASAATPRRVSGRAKVALGEAKITSAFRIASKPPPGLNQYYE